MQPQIPVPLERAPLDHHCSLVTVALQHVPSQALHLSQRYFLKFCLAEFSSENPEYWLAVQASARSTGQPLP